MREIPPPENGCWPMRGHFPRHFLKTYSKYDIKENPPKSHISVTDKTNNCTYLHVFYRQNHIRIEIETAGKDEPGLI